MRRLKMLMKLAFMFILVACYDEKTDLSLPSQEMKAAYIHVSVDVLGDLNSTRATDLYAVDGEFMNSLCIFVVDANGVIEAKLGPGILDGNAAAARGNLTAWTSDKLTLTAGDKTIYAFSNWEYMGSTEWSALIAKTVGESITAADLNFAVDDPASKVDMANGQYIPMSGKSTTTISITNDLNYNPELIYVSMDRLVGKVTIMIDGETNVTDDEGRDEAQDVTLKYFSFSGLADKVPMMSDDTNKSTYIYAYDRGYETELNQKINVGATNVQVASFYVNETTRPADSGGFNVTLETNRYGGISYSAATSAMTIPRNYILPIRLTLDQNVLDLMIYAWTTPLGVEEVAYYNIDIEDNTWNITLLDVTTTFEFTPIMYYKGVVVDAVTWTWDYLNADEAMITIDDDTGAITVTKLTATPGYEYQFTLVASWTTDSTILHSRSYNVNVIFVDGWPDFTSRATGAWSFVNLQEERLKMMIKNK